MVSHIHIIDRDARRRAEAARAIMAISHHAEIYESHAEFCQRPRETGIVLIEEGEAEIMLTQTATPELGLPVIVFAESPQTESIVDAIKAGAVDYLEWPIATENLRGAIGRAELDQFRIIARQRRRAEARRRTNSLSTREIEVLLGIVEGGSSKSIGEALKISARTVEVHRANVMRKLGARSSADAVRIALHAGFEVGYDIAA